MKKLVIVLIIGLALTGAIAVKYSRDAQRERERAQSAQARLAELEPVERGGGSPLPVFDAESLAPPVKWDQQPPIETQAAQDAPARRRSLMEYKGSLRSRRLVWQLQDSLQDRTPLQEYQIQPLITALDEAAHVSQGEGQGDARAASRHAIVQAAAPILFESQLEVLISLIED